MRQILMIGIGQTGSVAAELFINKLNNSGICCKALAIDTDDRALSEISVAQKIAMTDECSLSSVVERLGEDDVKNYFPCDWESDNSIFAKGLDMRNGANLWRMKAFLSFNSFLSKKSGAEALHSSLDAFASDCGENEVEVYTAASLAGGTGSGLLLPVVLYIKKYLESIGVKVVCSSAYLVMPDVFKDVLLSERGAKGYANAYCALREINAVNSVAFAGCNPEQLTAHPPIDFEIKLSCGKFTALFDSKNEEFHTPEAAPFDKMVLFEKVPTVNTIAEHISILADSMAFACSGEPVENLNVTTTGAVIGSESVTRVCYPIDSIVEYISNHQLYNFVCNEIGGMAKIAEQHLQGRILNARNERRRLNETVEAYRDSYIMAVEDTFGKEGDFPEVLIGRPADANIKLDLPQKLYDYSWEARLDVMIEGSVLNEGFDYVKKCVDTYKNDAQSKKISGSKARMLITAAVAEIKPRLESAYSLAQAAINEGKDDFVESLISCGNDGDFALIKDIICEDGSYLHPIYALFKLCLAHKKLEIHKNRYTSVPDKPIENYPFPIEIMRMEKNSPSGGAKAPGTKYYKYGENRFKDLFAFKYFNPDEDEACDDESDKKKKKKVKAAPAVVADDCETFYSDLEAVYGRLLDGIKHYRYLTVIEQLEVIIERYRSLINVIYGMREEVASDVTLSLVNGSLSNAITVNVGASEEEKKYLFNEYIEKYNADIRSMLSNDMIIAEKAAALVCSDVSARAIGHSAVRRLLADTIDVYRSHLKNSKFYRENIDKDIFCAMEDSVNCKFADTGTSYSKILASRYKPLKVSSAGINRDGVVSYSRLMVPSSVYDLVSSNPERFDDKTPEEYINGIVSGYSEYGTKINFLRNVKSNELFICRATIGFPLDSVEQICEVSDGNEGYTAYINSINAIKTRQTSMWDPALIYNRRGYGILPFISPVAQDEYEDSVAKAVAYGFLNDDIFVFYHEKMGKMYFAKNGFECLPICIGDVPVEIGNIRDVMLWVYEHVDWVKKQASRYHSKSSSFEELEATMMELLTALEKQGALDLDGYAQHIAKVVNEVFVGLYIGKPGGFTDRDEYNYVTSVRKFFAKLEDRYGREQAEKYAIWFNSHGCFMDYSINYTFCEFKF